jgi:hypothetical protein
MSYRTREDSIKSGLELKKEVIDKLFILYLEKRKKIDDDTITKLFLDTTNGTTIKDKKLIVDEDKKYDLLQGLFNKESEFRFRDMFKIRLSDFISLFLGIDIPQQSISELCEQTSNDYASIRIDILKRKNSKEEDKDVEDSFNFCLMNTNHMFTQELLEYKQAFNEVNEKRIGNGQKKLKQSFYLPEWVNIALKLPKSTQNWNLNMLGTKDLSKQVKSFIVKYNKRDGEIPPYFEFLDNDNPFNNNLNNNLNNLNNLNNNQNSNLNLNGGFMLRKKRNYKKKLSKKRKHIKPKTKSKRRI